MNEYRTTTSLTDGSTYYWVELGPIPGYPSWHPDSEGSKYPFPTRCAAELFTHNHRRMWPGRIVRVITEENE